MLQLQDRAVTPCGNTRARKNTTRGEHNKYTELHAGASCHAERCVPPPPSSRSAVFLTFWEVNDCVQWYKTSLSLLKGLGSAAGSSHSSPSVTFPSSSIAEMGHQLQLVGVTWLEDAMTERFACVQERREGTEGEGGGRERDSAAVGAQHHPPHAGSSGAEFCFTSGRNKEN